MKKFGKKGDKHTSNLAVKGSPPRNLEIEEEDSDIEIANRGKLD
jgi:hypothetical protein